MDLLNKVIEMPIEKLKDGLPPIYDQIKKNGVEKSMSDYPGIIFQILMKLEDSDLGKLGTESPKVIDDFLEIFWEGVSKRSETIKPFLEQIVKPMRKFVVNFETFDTPLKAHYEVSGGKIQGGLGLVKFRESDCRWLADTKIILKLMRGQFDMIQIFTETLFFDGYIGLLTKKAVPLNAIIGSLIM